MIKDISSSGYLLASQRSFAIDEEITVVTVLGTDMISIKGKVTRAINNESDDHPLFLAGIDLSESQPEDIDNILGIAEKADELLKI